MNKVLENPIHLPITVWAFNNRYLSTELVYRGRQSQLCLFIVENHTILENTLPDI